MIYAIALFTILIIDHGVIKAVYVTTGFPGGGMHKDGGVNAHNIILHLGHPSPPIIFYVFFELRAPLTVVIHSLQSVVYFTAGKNKSVLFTMRYNRLKLILCCHKAAKIRANFRFVI